MTVKNEQVVLSARDWLWIIFTVAAGLGSISTLHYRTVNDLNSRIDAIDTRIGNKLDKMQEQWSREAPAPAKWTVDAVMRLDKITERLEARILSLEQKVK